MYHLDKLVKIPNVIDLPTCMYDVEPYNKNSCQDKQCASDENVNCMEDDCLVALEKRQDGILQRLQELKKRLNVIQESSGVISQGGDTRSPLLNNDDSIKDIDLDSYHNLVVEKLSELSRRLGQVVSSVRLASAEKGTVHDLVISASPKCPPYSLLILRSLLDQAGIFVYSMNQVHSSVNKVDDSLKQLFTNTPKQERSAHHIAFTVQWKNVDHPTLMVNPINQTLICREVNIVRYISRLFPQSSPIHYEAMSSFTDIAERDLMLDRIQDLLNNKNTKDRNSFVHEVNERLKKTKYMLGDKLDVVDVLAWSAIRQNNLQTGCPSETTKWFNEIKDIAQIGTAFTTHSHQHPGHRRHFYNRHRKQSEKSSSTRNKQRTNSQSNTDNPKVNKKNQRQAAKSPAKRQPSPTKEERSTSDKNTDSKQSSYNRQGHSRSRKQSENASPSKKVQANDSSKTESNQANNTDASKSPVGREQLLSYLDGLGIKYVERQHKKVFNVEEMMECLQGFPGVTMKNLFLKDKKKNYYLLAAPHDAKVDLTAVAKQIKTKDLRFGDEAVMFDLIGVKLGSVTPYALINDKENKVKLLLDSEILNQNLPYVNFHPVTNDATIAVAPADFLTFLSSIKHVPVQIKI